MQFNENFVGPWYPFGWKKLFFPLHCEFSDRSEKSSKTLIDLQGCFLLIQIENYISLTTFGYSKQKILNIILYMQKLYLKKNSKRLWEYIKTKQKAKAFQRKYINYILLCTLKCDAFGDSSSISIEVIRTVCFFFIKKF